MTECRSNQQNEQMNKIHNEVFSEHPFSSAKIVAAACPAA